MAERNLLRRDDIPGFTAYLRTLDYTAVKTIGPYELLRAVHPSKKPIIIFRRGHGGPMASVQNQDMDVVVDYLIGIDRIASDDRWLYDDRVDPPES